MPSNVWFSGLTSEHLPNAVRYAVLAPEAKEPLPLCLFLLGAGGTCEMLRDMQPLFDDWWETGAVAPMAVVTPTPSNDYYIEETTGPTKWESFLALSLMPHIRANISVSDVKLLAGISGGGYGALKLAFGRPELFSAVAVMHPMIEPALEESKVGPRNRLHHTAGGPPSLVGTRRDNIVWEGNNPANRARANAERIIRTGLSIYLEAGDRDFLNAHDGTEFLHRLLWEMDVPHEYHVFQDADHGGPTIRPRLRSLFTWLGRVLHPIETNAAVEEAVSEWLSNGMQGKPPEGATTTFAFVNFLRSTLDPARAKATENDPSVNRRYGRMRGYTG